MAAPHYAEVLNGGPRPVFGEPPTRLLDGAWKMWFKSRVPKAADADFGTDYGSAYGSTRTLVWVKKSGGGESFSLIIHNDGACKARLTVDGDVLLDREITFSAGQRMRFIVDAEAGTLEIAGATTGDGLFQAEPWSAPSGGGEWRIGTGDSAANPARGYVSLPYG